MPWRVVDWRGRASRRFRTRAPSETRWLERYDVDPLVREFNCNWITGLNEPPLARHWKEYVAGLARMLDEYFAALGGGGAVAAGIPLFPVKAVFIIAAC